VLPGGHRPLRKLSVVSPLWALPLIVLATGVAAVALVARHVVAAAAALRVDVVDLRRLAGEIDAVRADARGLRPSLVDPRRAHAAPVPSRSAARDLGSRIDR